MPIEFRCSHCSNVLKVKDEHAGKSARCPSCKEVTSIPLQSQDEFSQSDLELEPFGSQADPFGDVPASPGPFGSNNPYRSPSATMHKPNKPSGRTGAFSPTATDFESVFSTAWDCWKNNIGILVAMVAITWGVSIGISFAGNIVQGGLAGVNAHEVAIVLFLFIWQIVGWLIGVFLQLGQIKICLRLARGQHTELGDMFSCGDKLLPAMVAGIIFSLMATVGFLLLIIPGIIVCMLFWTYLYLIADNRAGIVDSISTAFEIGKLNLWPTFLIGAVSILLMLAGLLACFVGLLFSTGLVFMLGTVAYLKMTNQL